jgi:hypothetical protein
MECALQRMCCSVHCCSVEVKCSSRSSSPPTRTKILKCMRSMFRYTARHVKTLQDTASLVTLQDTATHCKTLQQSDQDLEMHDKQFALKLHERSFTTEKGRALMCQGVFLEIFLS